MNFTFLTSSSSSCSSSWGLVASCLGSSSSLGWNTKASSLTALAFHLSYKAYLSSFLHIGAFPSWPITYLARCYSGQSWCFAEGKWVGSNHLPAASPNLDLAFLVFVICSYPCIVVDTAVGTLGTPLLECYRSCFQVGHLWFLHDVR